MFSLALGPTKYIGSPDKEVTPETILFGKNIINKLVLASQSGLTPCYSVDCCPPGSSVHGISHTRILERVVIRFSRGSSWPRDWTQVSCTAGAARETHYYQYLKHKCFILWVSISEVAIWKTRKEKKKKQMGKRGRKKISCMNSEAGKAGTIAFSKMLSDIFSRGD